MIYLVNLTIAGQPYTLQLDSGSSDLWIAVTGAAPGKQSDLTLNLTYGIGHASGPIATADVTIGELVFYHLILTFAAR